MGREEKKRGWINMEVVILREGCLLIFRGFLNIPQRISMFLI
jgi:hypothetical protein